MAAMGIDYSHSNENREIVRCLVDRVYKLEADIAILKNRLGISDPPILIDDAYKVDALFTKPYWYYNRINPVLKSRSLLNGMRMVANEKGFKILVSVFDCADRLIGKWVVEPGGIPLEVDLRPGEYPGEWPEGAWI